MLNNVELVVDNATLQYPLFEAQTERLPHVHTACLDTLAAPPTQFGPEKLVQRLLLPVSAEPQWLAGSRLHTTVRNLSLFPR